MARVINTLNETHLHKTLKQIYSLQNPESKQEVPVGSYIADILTKQGNIIEIQTGNLSSLKKKCEFYISEKRKITVVYPLVKEKFITTYDVKNLQLRKRKSPIKKNIFSIFKELTGIYQFLLNPKFTLQVVEVIITEERQDSGTPEQSKNKRRRFKKTWNKEDKKLDQILKTYTFKGKEKYLTLLPKNLDEYFTVKDVYAKTKEIDKTVKENDIRLMLWVFLKIGIIEQTGKKGKAFLYKIAS